jgi:flagellar motor switch protein FliN/FliY
MVKDDPNGPTEADSVQKKPAPNALEEADKATPKPSLEDGSNIDAILGVKLDVRIVLGRTRLPISELLRLTKGSVIELDRKVGEPVDVMINDRVVARGDLVKVKDDMIGVALREIIKDFVQKL